MSLSKRFLDMPNGRPAKAIGMAALIGFSCALLVSVTAVLLQPKRLANIALENERKMELMLSELPGLEAVLRDSGADTLQTVLIDLNTGIAAEPEIVEQFDSADKELMITLDKAVDVARIATRPNYVQVHLLQKQGQLELLVLPIYGKGYQSTIKAWLTLSGDLNTVVALSVFEQGETPGIGSRITEDAWLKLWSDKKVYDVDGNVALTVVKGSSTNHNEVDGLSGATRSGQGISAMLEFWLGDYGFARFLANLRDGVMPVSAG